MVSFTLRNDRIQEGCIFSIEVLATTPGTYTDEISDTFRNSGG